MWPKQYSFYGFDFDMLTINNRNLLSPSFPAWYCWCGVLSMFNPHYTSYHVKLADNRLASNQLTCLEHMVCVLHQVDDIVKIRRALRPCRNCSVYHQPSFVYFLVTENATEENFQSHKGKHIVTTKINWACQWYRLRKFFTCKRSNSTAGCAI